MYASMSILTEVGGRSVPMSTTSEIDNTATCFLKDIHMHYKWLLEKEDDDSFGRPDIIAYTKNAFASLFSRALKQPSTSLYSLHG